MTSDERGCPMVTDGARRFLFALPVILTLVLGTAAFGSFQVGSYHDDAWYINMATALARGKGYVRLWTQNQMAETLLPPGYPVLLAPLRFLFPQTFVPLQVLSLLAAAGSMVLASYYYLRRLPWWLAWLATLALAVNALLVKFGGIVMADTVYTLMSLGVLLLVERTEKHVPRQWLTAFVIGLIATAAFFVRTWGITLVAAVLVWYALRRRWAGVVGAAVPFAAAAGLWLARNTMAGGTGLSYGIGAGTLPQLWERLVRDSPGIIREHWSNSLPVSFLPQMDSPRLASILPDGGAITLPLAATLLLAVLLIGYVVQLRRWSLAEIYVVLYVAVLPLVEAPSRYWLPVLPFLLGYLGLGLMSLSALLLRRWPTWQRLAVAAVLLLLVVANTVRDVSSIVDPAHRRVPDVAVGPTWLAAHAPHDAIIMTNIPRVSYLYGERIWLAFPDFGDEQYDAYPDLRGLQPRERFLEALGRYPFSYILVEPALRLGLPLKWTPYVRDVVVPVLEADRQRFELVFASDDGLIRVYRVKGE